MHSRSPQRHSPRQHSPRLHSPGRGPIRWIGRWLLSQGRSRRHSGFTILETLVAMMIIGLLMTLFIGSWLSWLNIWNLSAAQDESQQIIRTAQVSAKQSHQNWQASFRNDQNQVQWATHPVLPSSTALATALVWNPIHSPVQIDPAETTLYHSSDGIYRVQFNHNGHVNGRLGRLTFKGLLPHPARRCVFVSTLIGALRKAKDQSTPQNGRRCY